MPSKSQKQHNLMELVAHDPAASKRLGIPQSVGMDFEKADKGKKFDAQSPAPYYGGASRGAYDGCGPSHDGKCLCGRMK